MKPTEIIRQYTPFRIYKMRFSEYKNLPRSEYQLSAGKDVARLYDLFPFEGQEQLSDLEQNTFIVKMLLPKTYERDSDNWHYWYVRSEYTPSNDECIHTLFNFLNKYAFYNLCDLLKEWKQDYEIDLNTLDLDITEERRRVANQFQECGYIQTNIGRFKFDSCSRNQNTDNIMNYYFKNVDY